MIRSLKYFSSLIIISLLLGSCAPQVTSTSLPPDAPTILPSEASTSTAQPNITETLVIPSPTQEPVIAINPLTGLAVQDSTLLDLPAALVSISHFPPTARPQAGLSFAPFVFEIYITEGATRFLTTFYGEMPQPEPVVSGGCEVRTSPFLETALVLGNRVWWDANRNQRADDWERGVGGVCINLYDENNNLVQQTTTDSNGYYAFNVAAGTYVVEALKPTGMEFNQKDVGAEDQDSDVDQVTGRSEAVNVVTTLLDLDVGLMLSDESLPIPNLVPPQVGPVRSGRLIYADIAAFFPGSCLIFAYASSEVLPELPKCSFVDHILQGGGYMLEIEEMKRLVTERHNPETRTYYTSHAFSSSVPEDGKPATRLDIYIAWLNQSAWVYDAASQTYWRYVDAANPDTAGILRPEVDRLTKRQLQFENVIVLFTTHDVIKPTNLDIHLEQGLKGRAFVFRNGQRFEVHWSTLITESEITNGARKPMQFYYPGTETLFPLKPGRTWVLVVTPFTAVVDQLNGGWQLLFSQPPGAK